MEKVSPFSGTFYTTGISSLNNNTNNVSGGLKREAAFLRENTTMLYLSDLDAVIT